MTLQPNQQRTALSDGEADYGVADVGAGIAGNVATETAAALDRVLREEGVVSAYQPIVELDGFGVVGYEALARGPRGSVLEMPGALFSAAQQAGRLEELDWSCRAAAVRGALDTALARPAALFINIEPVASLAAIPSRYADLIEDAKRELLVVFEFTERALTNRPAEVLRAVRYMRRHGALIALDDVGVDPRSLALMPFLRPDVIKLDMSLIHGTPSLEMARTMHAVNAQAEAFGSVVLAEGIETDAHLERALGLGATHGQGWMFGRPGPPPRKHPGTATLMPAAVAAAPAPRPGTPFDLVARRDSRTRTSTKSVLLTLSLELERQALALGPEAVVISNLQREHHLSDRTRDRYCRLARHVAFAGLLGEGVSATPAPGVRGGSLQPDDPLVDEWNVCVISPHFAAAMVARDLRDRGPDTQRRFDYRLTYNRSTAVHAARLMMAKITSQR